MEQERKRVRVAAAVVVWEGKVLLARRSQGQKLAGLWEFPGGKIEPWETPQECVERELFEELGIRTSAGEVLAETSHDYEDVSVEMVAVRTELLGGEPTLTVHDRVIWVGPEELPRYKLAPADIPVAEKLQSGL